MAHAGFPWHTQARLRDGSLVSEKDGQLDASAPIVNGALTDTSSKSSSTAAPDTKHRANGSTKRRSDTVKSNHAPRQTLRFQIDPPPEREYPRPVERIPVRTIPPWVRDVDEDDLREAGILPDSPSNALLAQHNHTPSSLQRSLMGAEAKGGGFPTSSGGRRSEPTSRWISFARASAYPRENFDAEKVEPDWLNENMTDYAKPWLADHVDDDDEDGSDKYRAFRRKRRTWYKRAHFTVMRNPFIPLTFRVVVMVFAAVAMSLGASIHHENNKIARCINQPNGNRSSYCAGLVGQGAVDYERDPSALMAIIVDVVAIVYSLYITYDEYFSKPLGLRPAAAKVRLVLLDLFFIVFQSANLSLAFNSIAVDQGPCKAGDYNSTNVKFQTVCDRAEALSSVLLISLVAWLFTFSVSILRYVVCSPCCVLTNNGSDLLNVSMPDDNNDLTIPISLPSSPIYAATVVRHRDKTLGLTAMASIPVKLQGMARSHHKQGLCQTSPTRRYP